MDKQLMDTFSKEQLHMCEKESLIEYINDIPILTDFYNIKSHIKITTEDVSTILESLTKYQNILAPY